MNPKEYKDFLILNNVKIDNSFKIIFDLIEIVNEFIQRVDELEKKYYAKD